MRVVLPANIGASLGADYVTHLNDESIARIETAPALSDGVIEITNHGEAFCWQLGSQRLRIDANCLGQARVSHADFGDSMFISVILVYGPDPSRGLGTSMLTSFDREEEWFRQFALKIGPLIPRGIDDRL